MRRQILSLVALLALAACTKDTKGKESVAATAAPAPAPAGEEHPYAASMGAQSPGLAAVKIEARAGFHVNPDYPVAFKPTAAPGAVRFTRERLPLSDGRATPCTDKAEDACAMEFDLSYPPEEVASSLQGVVAFSVCSADKCLIEKVPLTLALGAK